MRRFSAFLIAATAAVVVLQPAGAGPSASTGSGRVFSPNPVATLQDQTLTDQKDADYAALQPAYVTVTLTNLDGSGYLIDGQIAARQRRIANHRDVENERSRCLRVGLGLGGRRGRGIRRLFLGRRWQRQQHQRNDDLGEMHAHGY